LDLLYITENMTELKCKLRKVIINPKLPITLSHVLDEHEDSWC